MLYNTGGESVKKGDLIIFLVIIGIMLILGISYFIYVNSIGSDRYVNIYIEGKLYKSVKLEPDTDEIIIIDNEYGRNDIHIHNGGFQVIYADCPNQVDVRQGFVNMPGIAVICVPHKLKIVIEGDGQIIDDISQ